MCCCVVQRVTCATLDRLTLTGTRDGVSERAKTRGDWPGEPSAGKKARGGRGRKPSRREVSPQQGSESIDVDVVPEARQEVIDDYDDADFEARQVWSRGIPGMEPM